MSNDATTHGQSSSEKRRLDPLTGLASLLTIWSPTLAGTTKWTGRYSEGLAMLNSEWLEFVARRTSQDVALMQRPCSCQSPVEARTVYADFWQQAVADCQKESKVLSKLAGGVMSQGVVEAHSRMAEAASAAKRLGNSFDADQGWPLPPPVPSARPAPGAPRPSPGTPSSLEAAGRSQP
jgi:hypothetical protein